MCDCNWERKIQAMDGCVYILGHQIRRQMCWSWRTGREISAVLKKTRLGQQHKGFQQYKGIQGRGKGIRGGSGDISVRCSSFLNIHSKLSGKSYHCTIYLSTLQSLIHLYFQNSCKIENNYDTPRG